MAREALALATTMSVPTGAFEVRMTEVGEAPEKRQKAEWQALFTAPMSTHMARKPKGQGKTAWREQFFALYPEAREHPGCPPELL